MTLKRGHYMDITNKFRTVPTDLFVNRIEKEDFAFFSLMITRKKSFKLTKGFNEYLKQRTTNRVRFFAYKITYLQTFSSNKS